MSTSRYWWLWLIGLTFGLTWGVLYVGYMVDDRVYDTVVVLVQAIILTFLVTLVVLLFVPRADATGKSKVSTRVTDDDIDDVWQDDRHDPVLHAHAKPAAASHYLDLRGLTITLLEMMALSERYDRNLTLVLMAVDDINVVRDEYGQRAAQRVIDEVADVLSDALRIPDRSGIYAENRFLVILPETTVDSGRQIAERVRRQVVDTEVRIDARRRISATVSAGVTGFKPGDDPQAILDRVANALVEAQALGNNHSIIWSPPDTDVVVAEPQDSPTDVEVGVDDEKPAKLH